MVYLVDRKIWSSPILPKALVETQSLETEEEAGEPHVGGGECWAAQPHAQPVISTKGRLHLVQDALCLRKMMRRNLFHFYLSSPIAGVPNSGWAS